MKIVGKFFAFILCIVLFVVDLAFLLTISVRTFTSRDNVADIFGSYSLDKAFTLEIDEFGKNLEDELKDFADSADIDFEKLKSLFDKAEVLSAFGEIIGSFTETIISGDINNFISEADMIKLIESRIDKLIELNDTGIKIDKNEIMDAVTENIKPIREELLTVFEDDEIVEITDVTGLVFGNNTLLIAIGVIVLLVLLICLCNWNFITGVKVSFIVSSVVGGIIVLLGAFTNFLFDMLVTAVDELKELESALLPIVGNIQKTFIVNGMICLVGSILIIVVMSKIKKKNKNDSNINQGGNEHGQSIAQSNDSVQGVQSIAQPVNPVPSVQSVDN